MRKVVFLAAALLAGAVSAPSGISAMPLVRLAQAASKHPAAPTIPDTSDYIRASVMGDMFEIQAAKVAQARSHNADIQRFATMMIHDHGEIADGLAAILKQGSFDFAPPATLDSEHAAMVSELNSLADASFDRSYVQQQIEAHEAALRLENDYAKGGRDQPLRKFAAQTAPKVHAHLELARQLYSRITRIASRSR